MRKKITAVICALLLLLVLLPSTSILAGYTDTYDGYYGNDYLKLQAFLNLPSMETGKTNGQKLNATYSQDDPTTWTGVTWTGTPKRAQYIFWWSSGLAGDLDLSDFTSLESLGITGSNTPSIDVSGDTALTIIQLPGDNISSLDIAGTTALTELHIYENVLEEIDFSESTALTEVYCYENNLTRLNLSNNINIARVIANDNPTKEINLNKNNVALNAYAAGNGTIALTWQTTPGPAYVFTAVPNADTTFVNWVWEGENVGDTNPYTVWTTAAGTLYANFSKATVTYDPNYSGASTWDELYDCGTITAPADPSRTGYIFGGWYTEATCENAWDFSTDTVTQDTTLYAYWYNADDYNKVRNFLLKTSAVAGKTNGQMLNASFDADDPETWSYVYWDDEGYVGAIYWGNSELAGSLDL
ncbi:MAG: InlB B-repeat-containing protein, partial [Dehalobacter sp.]|nr:InlB B-repeat-containing protein [Dehalobacter sp.]